MRSPSLPPVLDAVIVGGGPAGLSAALVLARCRRRLAVVDEGHGRNRAALELHGFLTRDGTPPGEFIRLGYGELAKYHVPVVHRRAVDAAFESGEFRVVLDTGESLRARKLLVATGVRDILPDLPGFDALYGVSIHHCPYCDGWEHRDQRLVAYGAGRAAVGLALSLRTWSESVTACTAGETLEAQDRARAERNGIAVREEAVTELVAAGGKLERIRFADGPDLACEALFFNTGQVQRSDLPRRLNCRFRDDGGVVTDNRQCTGVPGLYLAGDADKDVQFVINAAAEGATAAVAINRELQDEDRGERRPAPRHYFHHA